MKPIALPVNVEGIPDALKRERRWSVWRYRLDDKRRWTKKPLGKSNAPSTWLTFAEACALYRRGGWDGLVFALGDGWGGADLDDCCQDLRILYTGATRIIERFGCYVERSPGGTGLKLFFRAPRIGFEVAFKTGDWTRWRTTRWFTVTGHGSGDPTVDATAALDFTMPPEPEPPPSESRDGYPDAAVTSDDDLLLLMVGNDTNGDEILALWQGDKSAYGHDHSRADMALLRHLAFWTDYDAERMERLFRLSGLMRSHWDRSASYRRVSLTKALR